MTLFSLLLFNRFVLLKNLDIIKIKHNTFSGTITNATTSEKIAEIEIESDFNDNPFSKFLTSIESVYYWISGSRIQKDMFDSWPIDVLTLIASVFLISILQNMFIAFMRQVINMYMRYIIFFFFFFIN